VSKKSKDNPSPERGSDVVIASYKAGFAEGRLAAIEESMDALAALIFKAEDMIGGLGENAERSMRDSAEHTLRALNLAFAAVTGSVNGSPAFRDLLNQSRQRLRKQAGAIH